MLRAIADEHDMHDEADVVALLGAVMFHRDLCPPPRAELSRALDAAVDARAAELTGDPENARRSPPSAGWAAPCGGWGAPLSPWRASWEASARRPDHPLDVARASGRVAGKYLGEWSGLKKAEKAGEA